MNLKAQNRSNVFLQLVYLVLLCFASAMVCMLLAMVVYFVTSNNSIASFTDTTSLINDLNFLRTVQISSTIGMFIIGPLIFCRLEAYQPAEYYKFKNSPLPVLLILIVFLMLMLTPVLEWLITFNSDMKLPEAVKGIENWMRQKEDEAEKVMTMLIKMDNFGMYLFNLLMIAVIPAIGEELTFRGALQNILFRWVNNKHVVIWVSAAVFSAIHFQFYGFLPRMLLGGVFGYLMIYGQSIWYPILGHFINNAVAVTMAYIYLQKGKPIDNLENETFFSPAYYLISAAISLVLMLIFKTLANKKTVLYE